LRVPSSSEVRTRAVGDESRLRQVEAALDQMPYGLCVYDARQRLVTCNRRYAEIFALPAEVAKPGASLAAIMSNCAAAVVSCADAEVYVQERLAAAERNARSTAELHLADGRIIRVVQEPTPDGGWVATHEDITEHVQIGEDLRRARSFLSLVIESVPDAILVKDASNGRFAMVNHAAEKLFGLHRKEFIGKTAEDIYPAEYHKIVAKEDAALLQAGELFIDDHTIEMRGRESRIITLTRKILRDGESAPQFMLAVMHDITERKRAERRIAHMALHDTLTDLPNRTAFNERLAAVLARADAGLRFAVLFVDLDRLKEVNDVFGHAAGDQLLREVAKRMRAAAGDDFIARLGGDEFALLTENAESHARVGALAERLLASVQEDLEIQGARIRSGLSIGVAMFPGDGRDSTVLLANADAALYRAKAEGRGVIRFFKSEMDARLRDRHVLRHDLSTAISRGELMMHYQPQAKVTGEVVSFEALLRWRHPQRGMVSPATFIPLAEESRLISTIGEWALRSACREAAAWPVPLGIAVNLSPGQFQHADLPALVHSILLETGLPARRLELEITEGVLIADSARALSVLRRLKAFGIQITMDDFGQGYSSLSYLQSFPFDRIKIDRAFVSKVTQNPQSAAIVRAVLGLARGLGLPVLAEGVETAEELAFLAAEACDEVQGYLIGRPCPIEDYAKILGRAGAPQQIISAGNGLSRAG
jgi:diguanylate cyclase (GGDEF)-like protein/PAS domain S-box-containing protein